MNLSRKAHQSSSYYGNNMLINYELKNSCPEIPVSTWEHDGVLPKILGPVIAARRKEMGVVNPVETPCSAEELIGILTELADEAKL